MSPTVAYVGEEAGSEAGRCWSWWRFYSDLGKASTIWGLLTTGKRLGPCGDRKEDHAWWADRATRGTMSKPGASLWVEARTKGQGERGASRHKKSLGVPQSAREADELKWTEIHEEWN